MSGPYVRVVDKPTGKVTIAPTVSGIPTHGVPALGLTVDDVWVPLQLGPDGSVVLSPSTMTATPHFDDALADVTPGLTQILIDAVVPANTQRSIGQVIVTTRVTGVFWVTANGAIIGSGRTGPGCYSFISFLPQRPLESGTEYQVLFASRLNAPLQTVECYVQASDTASS